MGRGPRELSSPLISLGAHPPLLEGSARWCPQARSCRICQVKSDNEKKVGLLQFGRIWRERADAQVINTRSASVADAAEAAWHSMEDVPQRKCHEASICLFFFWKEAADFATSKVITSKIGQLQYL